MKIELKKVYVNERMSEETTMFQADVYVDGILAMYAKNDGHGGSTFYNSYEGMNNVMLKAESYVATLPPFVYKVGKKEYSIKSSLEMVIDGLVDDFLKTKDRKAFEKKKEKAMLTKIVWGVPNGDTYNMMGFKQSLNLAEANKTLVGKAAIQGLVNIVKKKMKKDEVIFNKIDGLL